MLKKSTILKISNDLGILFILSNAALYLDTISILRWSVSILRIFAVLYAFLIAIPRLRFERYTRWVMLFFVVAGIFTVIYSGSIHAWAANAINSIGLILLIYLSIQEYPKHTINWLSRIFECFIYLNFILTLIEPDGIFEGSYLLGLNHNQIGATLVCGLTTQYLAYKQANKSWFAVILLCIVCIITPILVGSMTSAIGCVLLSLFFLIPTKKIKRIFLITFFGFYLLFQGGIVFLQKDLSNNSRATFFVEEVLEKDMSFTNRYSVWQDAYEMIQSSPVTGYGMQEAEWFEKNFFVKSAHNILYQIQIYGGYILLGIFLFIIFMSVRRSIILHSELSAYTLAGLLIFFFMMIVEAYSLAHIFFMLGLVYYSYELSQEEKTI